MKLLWETQKIGANGTQLAGATSSLKLIDLLTALPLEKDFSHAVSLSLSFSPTAVCREVVVSPLYPGILMLSLSLSFSFNVVVCWRPSIQTHRELCVDYNTTQFRAQQLLPTHYYC